MAGTVIVDVISDKIAIAAPCKANWDDMRGDHSKRFCGGCSKHVYNLSAMSQSEAESLAEKKKYKLAAAAFEQALVACSKPDSDPNYNAKLDAVLAQRPKYVAVRRPLAKSRMLSYVPLF